MKRIWMLAGLVTLLGATTSTAQYQDSQLPEDQYAARYETESTYDPSYDYELLGPPEDRYYSEPDIDVGIFASLGHDGRWHMTASYGWVWRPYARTSWRPYTAGRWVWTSYGWTWLSYEPFGWATYHYGHWVHDGFLGWVWIPGYEWSASRVQFAYYDNYVCWTPLPRPGYYFPTPWSTAGVHIWFTIGADRFCDPYPARYYVQPKYKSVYRERIAYKTPDRGYVERFTRAPIHKSTVKFKHTSWSKNAPAARVQASKGLTRSNAKALPSKTTKQRSFAPQVDKRGERAAVKTRSSKPLSRELRAPARSSAPRQSVSKSRPAVKPQREANQTRAMRSAPRKAQPATRPQFTTRANREPNRATVRQSRPAERSSKALTPSRGRTDARKSMTVNRGGGSRKSIASQRKVNRSDAAKLRKSTARKGRGNTK